MPAHEIELAIILRTFDDDAHIAEGLFYPEVSRYGDDSERLKKALVKNATRILEAESLPRFYARMAPAEIEIFAMNLHLEPPVKRLSWREPVELRLYAVRWRHGAGAHIAFIPALGIEVVSTSSGDLMAESGLTPDVGQISMLERHARAELMRRRATTNFQLPVSSFRRNDRHDLRPDRSKCLCHLMSGHIL